MADIFRRFVMLIAAFSFAGQLNPHACNAQDKQRLLVLTDFYKDPDDKQSMIRLLSCANEFEIEGLIATSLAFGDGAVHPEWILAQDIHPSSQDPDRRMRWTVGRWNSESSNDFAARMDWCVLDYEHANHHPIAVVDGNTTRKVLHREVVAGNRIQFDAAGSSDPDNDGFNYRWWQYTEAGSPDCAVELENADSIRASFQSPHVTERRSVHVVLTVSDEGQPPLTSYRRVIVSIKPSPLKSATHAHEVQGCGPGP
jgi:hypothetical protein